MKRLHVHWISACINCMQGSWHPGESRSRPYIHMQRLPCPQHIYAWSELSGHGQLGSLPPRLPRCRPHTFSFPVFCQWRHHSVHTTRPDKTVWHVGDVNWTTAFNVFRLQMFRRRQSWAVVARIKFIPQSPPVRTRQNSFSVSCGVNSSDSHSCFDWFLYQRVQSVNQ